MQPPRVPVKVVLLWVSYFMLPAAALLTLTAFLPLIDLTGPLAQTAYWTAESSSKVGIPLIGIAMTALVVSRSGLSWKERTVEALTIALGLAASLGGGAYLNEHFVKPKFAIPRPNIVELASTPVLVVKPRLAIPGNNVVELEGRSILEMSPEAFYAMPTKEVRSEHLTKVLNANGTPPMHEQVRRHWISESGYSFPSGHSFSSMFFATFFLAMGLSCISGRRLWVFYLLVLWAVAVCVSRPLLRVHSTADIFFGGLEGIAAGILAFLLVRWVIRTASPTAD